MRAGGSDFGARAASDSEGAVIAIRLSCCALVVCSTVREESDYHVAPQPKPLKEYREAFQRLQAAVAKGLEDQKGNSILMDRQRMLFDQGAAAIGQRVEILKKAGRAGNSIKDFLYDPDVKQYYAGIQEVYKNTGQEYQRALTATTGGLRRIVHDYDLLVKEVGDEVDRLVKAKDAGSIALNGLLNEMKKFRTQKADFFAYIKNGPLKFDPQKYDKFIDSEIQKTKVSQQSMLNRQKFDPRVFGGAYTHMKAQWDGVQAQLAKLKQARAKGDKVAINSHLKVIGMARDEFIKSYEPYFKAYEEYKDELANDRKDGPGAIARMKQLIAWRKELNTVARMTV